MKLKFALLTIVCFLLLFVTNFCSNKASGKDNSDEIFVCGKEAPQWFKNEIEEIARNCSRFVPVKVFIVDDSGVEYIAIENRDDNSQAELKVFLCSGIQIDAHHELYAQIVKKYRNREARLIWPE